MVNRSITEVNLALDNECFQFQNLFFVLFDVSVFSWHSKTSYGSTLILP